MASSSLASSSSSASLASSASPTHRPIGKRCVCVMYIWSLLKISNDLNYVVIVYNPHRMWPLRNRYFFSLFLLLLLIIFVSGILSSQLADLLLNRIDFVISRLCLTKPEKRKDRNRKASHSANAAKFFTDNGIVSRYSFLRCGWKE